jgi:hypothetical protein
MPAGDGAPARPVFRVPIGPRLFTQLAVLLVGGVTLFMAVAAVYLLLVRQLALAALTLVLAAFMAGLTGDRSVGRNRFIAPFGEADGAIKLLRPTTPVPRAAERRRGVAPGSKGGRAPCAPGWLVFRSNARAAAPASKLRRGAAATLTSELAVRA